MGQQLEMQDLGQALVHMTLCINQDADASCVHVVQLEMQELRRQVRTLTLALATKGHGSAQGLHQQNQQRDNKGRGARTDKDGRWHRLPRPRVTIRMKVAAMLAGEAANAERAAEPKAEAHCQVQTNVGATARACPQNS